MAYRYSRKAKVEAKKNTRKAVVFSVLTIIVGVVFYFVGLPAFVKFAAFLTELRSTTTTVETHDNTPPPPPRFETLPQYTNEQEVKVKGRTEPGVNVKISFNGKEETILSDSEGEFNYVLALRDGENKIAAIAEDESGNQSQETETFKITFDNKPPELKVEKPEDGSEFYGSTERQIVIEGTTEENAAVNINGRMVIVDSNGRFIFATTLQDGENNFEIKAQDRAGNSSEESLNLKFTS